MASSSRQQRQPLLDHAFPFRHDDLVLALLRECRGVRLMTGSYDVLHEILRRGEMYLRSSQCSLNKALEKVCGTICITFGPTVHPRFWRIVKGLCNARGINGREARRPHPYAPCMGSSVVVDEAYGQAVWVIAAESWLTSPRPRMEVMDSHENLRRTMNFLIVEAIVHHQLEHSKLWKHVPDYNPIFMALTLARRGTDNQFTAEMASHFASIAVRYDTDESRHASAAFKGLRRWRNVSTEMVTQLTLKSIWGHKETPRHHQLWHLHRILNEKGLRDMRSTINEAIFLLLVTVINDHVFASIPPEDAAECVVNALFTKYDLTSKQRFDMSRIHLALRQPRSPYLNILFKDESSLPVEMWERKLSSTPPPPPPPPPPLTTQHQHR